MTQTHYAPKAKLFSMPGKIVYSKPQGRFVEKDIAGSDQGPGNIERAMSYLPEAGFCRSVPAISTSTVYYFFRAHRLFFKRRQRRHHFKSRTDQIYFFNNFIDQRAVLIPGQIGKILFKSI